MRLHALALLLCLAASAFAADPNSSSSTAAVLPVEPARAKPRTLGGANEFTVWGAGTLTSANVIALSHDRRVSLVSLRYGRRLWQSGLAGFTYTADVHPVVLVSQPRNWHGWNTGGREVVYGGGFSPFGFRADLLPRRRWQPFLDASAGAVFFTRNAPYSDGSRFNYMFDTGFGVRFFDRPGRAFTFGAKYHHISNNYRTPHNPGIDSVMLYTGFTLFR